MKKFALVALSAGILLVGCKTEIEKDISVNRLVNEPIHTEIANLRVEVAGCNDYKDSRNPSKALIQVQQKVPLLFSGAVYKECYSANLKSFASFDIPVGVGKFTKGDQKPETDINIYHSDSAFLNASTKKSFKEKLQQFKENEILGNSFKFTVSFNLTNDTNENYNVTAMSSYVNDEPVIGSQFEFPKNTSIKIQLSDVATDNLMSVNSSTDSPVLF